MSLKRFENLAESVTLPTALLADRRINLNDLRVLMALFAHDDGSGVSQPTREKLAETTGLPPSRVSTTTTRLVQLGWLRKESGFGKSTTRYQLPVVTAEERDPEAGAVPGDISLQAIGPDRESFSARQVAPDRGEQESGSDPELRSQIQNIVKEELTRLNSAGHLAGREVAPGQKIMLRRFRKPEEG